MKRALYDEICSYLTLDRDSVDVVIQKYPNIDPQVLLAIYMRKSLYLYRSAHAALSAQEFPPDHFYRHFRMRCEQRQVEHERVIKEIGAEVGLPPCLMARFILKSFHHLFPANDIEEEASANLSTMTNGEVDEKEDERGEKEVKEEKSSNSSNNNNNNNNASSKGNKIATARITRMLREPELIRLIDPILADNLQFCLLNDFLTSPLTDQFRHQIGVEKENYMHARLREMNILFHSEAAMRAAGYPKTPDALLAYPVEIDGQIVNWIESKALFSDLPTHQTYLREQYWPYYNRFGPGLVIYWFGFLDEIVVAGDRERERPIMVMDRFPDIINKIKLN